MRGGVEDGDVGACGEGVGRVSWVFGGCIIFFGIPAT